MELVTSVPKPEGFFGSRRAPGGMVRFRRRPPERRPSDNENAANAKAAKEPAEAGACEPEGLGRARTSPTPTSRSARNDLFLGNFNGFNTYDIDPSKKADAASPRSCARAARATCRSTATCCSCRSSRRAAGSTAARRASTTPVSAERFRGVRIFDISDIRKPKQVADVQTCRGSHTHTLVIDPKDHENLYVYGSGTSTVRSGEELAGCSGLDRKKIRTRRSSAST